MDVIRLTNLGNLTLRNLLSLDKTYDENADLKRKKLAKLWDSRKAMDAFLDSFSSYPCDAESSDSDDDRHLVSEGRFQETVSPVSKDLIKYVLAFRQMGLVSVSREDTTLEQLLLDAQRDEYANPIKYVNGVTVELTGLCNLNCKHCYRGGSREGEYGLPAEQIKKALEPLLRAGIKYVAFTGGEPTLRRDDLFDIIDYASQFMELKGVSTEERFMHRFGIPRPKVDDVILTERYVALRAKLVKQLSIPKDEILPGEYNICNENSIEDVDDVLRHQAKWAIKDAQEPSTLYLDRICILSNAFFDHQRDFVRKLKSYGNVRMQTSLDSYDAQTTDEHRGRKGVFAKVKQLAHVCDTEQFRLSITAHNIGGKSTKSAKKNEKYFNDAASLKELDVIARIGNAARYNHASRIRLGPNNGLGALSSVHEHADGWCKGFTRPDTLHIRPTGNVGNCNFGYALPEEFGSLYRMSMADIVNGIQTTQVYQMFMDGRIEQYQHELDQTIFSKKFTRSCEPIILTLAYGLIKERLIEQGVENPVEQANQEVAKLYGFCT